MPDAAVPQAAGADQRRRVRRRAHRVPPPSPAAAGRTPPVVRQAAAVLAAARCPGVFRRLAAASFAQRQSGHAWRADPPRGRTVPRTQREPLAQSRALPDRAAPRGGLWLAPVRGGAGPWQRCLAACAGRWGASFRQVRDEVRRQRASEMLLAGRAIREVAKACGFAELSPFYRAFRRWHAAPRSNTGRGWRSGKRVTRPAVPDGRSPGWRWRRAGSRSAGSAWRAWARRSWRCA